MTTLTKIIVATLLSLCLVSCNFDINFNTGVKGNGNVTIEERDVNASFSSIKATEGLNVYLTQADTESITVEADENLQELILTEINDGILKIHTKQNIGRSTSKKIMVSFKDVSKIVSTSGSSVYSENGISASSLELKSTSGSNMKLELNTNTLNSTSTSGSNMRLSGTTTQLIAEATSGSTIKAGNLKSESTKVKATSGANITVNTSKQLTAKASSGASIKYYGDPESVDQSAGGSGSISRK
jgi:hypothetical protein